MKFSYVLLLTVLVSSLSLVGCTKDEAILPPKEIVHTGNDKPIPNSYTKSLTYYSSLYASGYAKTYWSEKKAKRTSFAYYSMNNCTNFVSQCILAGFANSSNASTVYSARNTFNDSQTSNDWFYSSSTNRSASWAGVDELYYYAQNNNASLDGGIDFNFIDQGSANTPLDKNLIQVGDIVFMNTNGIGDLEHVMIVTGKTSAADHQGILVTGHTYHQENDPLDWLDGANPNITYYVYRPMSFN